MLKILPKLCDNLPIVCDCLSDYPGFLPVLAGISTFTMLVICLNPNEKGEAKKIIFRNTNSNNNKPALRKSSCDIREDQTEQSQTNIDTLFDYIVQENEGTPKDQRLADILSSPLPPSGFKEVFLSSEIEYPGHFKVKDLIEEVKNKEESIREAEMRLLQYSLEKNRLRDDINLLKSQLEAEEQLRIQAESKSSLMHKELEKLHKITSDYNITREDLKQKIRKVRIEVDLIDASRSDSDDSITKVQKAVSEIHADHSRTQEEVLNLRETNKILTQKTAHQRQKRDHLLKQRYYYQQHLSSITSKTSSLDVEEPELEEYPDLRTSNDETLFFQDNIDTVSDDEKFYM